MILKFSYYFKTSLDFIVLGEKNNYPNNLELISLAKKLDIYSEPQERTHIEVTAKSFLRQSQNDKKITLKQDKIDLKLTNNIQENIKLLKEDKEVSQREIAEYLGVNQSQVAHYFKRSIPPADKLIKLSKFFNVSIHALATGEKLYFNFKDGHFGDTILLADKLLSLEHQKFLIELMENIINDKK
jgi:transcriptional regulator with XRE-family HTH domain